MSQRWIAERMHHIDASGIRKVFDLAATMKNPINLSIGQPHFDTPDEVKDALCAAVRAGRNVYSQTQGIASLLEQLRQRIHQETGQPERQVFVSSGTSGGLMLALQVLVNPGDEVIVFDPYFVMYRHLTTLCGGRVVPVSTYPDFRIDVERVQAAMTDKTKVVLVNSPANPTGAVASREELQPLAELCQRRGVVLISDEIYREFCYDQPFVSPVQWNPETLVIDGFSKSHSMTGLRLGFAHGPAEIIQQMIKLQQFTFVCAPQPVQWAGIAALDVNVADRVADYHRKRDRVVAALREDFEVAGAQGAFYAFPKAPGGSGSEFVQRALARELLIIPGNVFSGADSHFRISYATSDDVLDRGLEVLRSLVRSS